MLGGENKKLRNAGGGIQIYLLLALWFLGMVLAGSLVSILTTGDTLNGVYNIRVSHVIQGLMLFLMPATVYCFFFLDKKGVAFIEGEIKVSAILVGVALVVIAQPFTSVVNQYNELISFTDSYPALQEFFDKSKDYSLKAFKLVTADPSLSNVLTNILIIAIIPGIVEELFFRGCMQRAFGLMVKNKHVAIWLTAIVFSLFHFQLSGFFARIIFGAMLGYMYAYTRNIWVPIIAHVVNNAFVIILVELSKRPGLEFLETFEYTFQDHWYLIISSFTLSILGIYFLIKQDKKQME